MSVELWSWCNLVNARTLLLSDRLFMRVYVHRILTRIHAGDDWLIKDSSPLRVELLVKQLIGQTLQVSH